jgi:hypothetical protein
MRLPYLPRRMVVNAKTVLRPFQMAQPRYLVGEQLMRMDLAHRQIVDKRNGSMSLKTRSLKNLHIARVGKQVRRTRREREKRARAGPPRWRISLTMWINGLSFSAAFNRRIGGIPPA